MEQALTSDPIIAIAFGIIGIVLIALWITLPFAVFRIKQRLDETNKHLEAIVEQLKALTDAGTTPSLDETNRHLKAIVEQLKTQGEAGATLSLDRTNRYLETIVKQLNAQTETTVHRKTRSRPLKDRSVTRLFRGEIEKEPEK